MKKSNGKLDIVKLTISALITIVTIIGGLLYAAVDKRNDRQDVDIRQVQSRVSDINASLRAIETNVEWMTLTHEDLKTAIEEHRRTTEGIR